MSERAGYARCSSDKQDLNAQREILLSLDVPEDRIYLDHGLTGTNRDQPAWPRPSLPCVPATPSSSYRVLERYQTSAATPRTSLGQ